MVIALLEPQWCSACGGEHNFYLKDPGGFSANRRYSFICPQTRRIGILQPGNACSIAPALPSNAVEARPIAE